MMRTTIPLRHPRDRSYAARRSRHLSGPKEVGIRTRVAADLSISLANQDFRTDLDSQPGGRRTYKMIYRLASGL